jgi:AcrR family transcriptional regulator
MRNVGRPKQFSRDGLLKKAVPVFWERGFADTGIQALEKATGVNKSGLYSEFKSKEDLYLASLKYYIKNRHGKELLTQEPLGWANVERFLQVVQDCPDGQTGCFAINSMRELAVVPSEAQEMVTMSLAHLKRLLAKNISAERTRLKPDTIAEMIVTMFVGLSLEQNLKEGRRATRRKLKNLMRIIRSL